MTATIIIILAFVLLCLLDIGKSNGGGGNVNPPPTGPKPPVPPNPPSNKGQIPKPRDWPQAPDKNENI